MVFCVFLWLSWTNKEARSKMFSFSNRCREKSHKCFLAKDKLMPLIHLFSWSCKKSAQSISRSTKAWKIKHYWQTQIVLKVMWLHVCTKGEEETWYAMLPRRLRPHITVRPSPTSHGSEYGKQLVSSAIWRWPSQNINFFCVFFFSPSNIIRRRPAEAPCCSNTLLLIAGIHFLFQFNVTVSKAILMPKFSARHKRKNSERESNKNQINRGKVKKQIWQIKK